MVIGTRSVCLGSSPRRILAASALGVGLLVGGLGAALSQEATPAGGRQREGNVPHPAHIHTGSCGEGELGDEVVPLTDLVEPRGRGAGNENAVTAATSFTTVPLTIDAILASDHAINVHQSAEAIGEYIACGELGGPLDDSGNLVVGLREMNGSNYAGIAFLSPAADGASTNVSVFIAQDRGNRNRDGGGRDGTPTAEMGGMGGMSTPAADDGMDAGAQEMTPTVEATATAEADDGM
jgi:hypothetical protein